MVIEFSVKNFRSIKDMQTLSFQTTGLKSAVENEEVDSNNIVDFEGISLFKTVGIYGANASGKSNIIKAFDYFLTAMSAEPSASSNLENLANPFLYQKDADNSESFFQIVLQLHDKKYRYGFTIKRNKIITLNSNKERSDEIITSEWLYGPLKNNNVALFQREGKEILTNKLPNKKVIPKEIPYEHTFYLKFAAAFDEDGICENIRQNLRRNTTSNLELNLEKYREITLQYIKGIYKESKADLLSLLASFGIKYSDIEVSQDGSHNPYGIMPLNKIYPSKLFSAEGEQIKAFLNMQHSESSGTQKLFDLCGLLLTAFKWDEPTLLIIDEIDSNFHPSLLLKLIGLFNNPSINKSNSQLLFTSHDTNLMSPKIMRRDQFYFTEKNSFDATRLYSLAELKGIRNNADFAKQYLAGIYGSLPMLKTLTFEKS